MTKSQTKQKKPEHMIFKYERIAFENLFTLLLNVADRSVCGFIWWDFDHTEIIFDDAIHRTVLLH